MSASVNMPGSVEFFHNGPTRFQTSQTSVEKKQRKKKFKRVYFTILITILFFVTFLGFVAFLYYLDVRLNEEIKTYDLRLSEQMKIYSEKINSKIQEYESQMQLLSYKIETIGSKNATKQSPLQSETVKYQAVPIENIEEFPEIEDIEDNGLINVDDIRANGTQSSSSRKNATKHSAPPPPLLGQQNKSRPRIPLPIAPSEGDDRAMGDETDPDDEPDSSEIDDEIADSQEEQMHPVPASKWPLRKRQTRSVDLASPGDGNLIERSHKRFQSRKRLNDELETCNQRLREEMKIYSEKINAKIQEYEVKIQLLSQKIDAIGSKDTTKLVPQQSSDSAKYQGIVIEDIREFPPASEGEDRTMGGEIGPEDEAETGDVDDEIDSSEERMYLVSSSKLTLQKRHKRSAELAGSGGGNLIDTSPEQFQHLNKSSKPEFSKLSSQNRTVSPCEAKPQTNSTPSEEPGKVQIQLKSSNKRSLSSSPSPKKLVAKQTSLSHEMEEESIDITETRSTVIAAHFGADSSKYNMHSHPQYDGNTHLRHPTGEYEDWRPSSWFDELNMDKHFALMNGNIKVHTSGLYFVYAQIFYSDLSDVNGYEVYLNSQVVLQCITSTYSLKNVTTKSNTCYTGGVIKCQTGDKISVKTVDRNRRVMLEASRSFVGMFKIGEFQSIK